MKESIGGYFPLELNSRKEYHHRAIHLNTGRNAIEFVLRKRGFKTGLLPAYSCDSILEPFFKSKIPFDYYYLDERMKPKVDFSKISKDCCIVLINYFGLIQRQNSELALSMDNVLIDNSQAFFADPLPGKDTIYSPRKFFGVPDGGYLYSVLKEDHDIEQDYSYDRFEHLLKRHELLPEEGLGSFRKLEKSLSFQPIRRMSRLTQSLLTSIDYDRVRSTRERNFRFLHEKLGSINKLTPIIEASEVNGPMVYPFLVESDSLREKLIQNRIFAAKYWEEVSGRVKVSSLEWDLANKMVPLPVDQRYSINDMELISRIIIRLI